MGDCSQGETISIEFSSSDATTAAAVTLKKSDGSTRTLAANEILLIDSLTCAQAAAVLLVQVIADVDADGNVDAGEQLAAFSVGNDASQFTAEGEGVPVKQGFTPKVKASGAGNVQLAGTGRIIFGGCLDGITRPSWKETR